MKTSSLGDIIQAFIVLPYLKKRFPKSSIDWVVEKKYESFVRAHPLIHKTLGIDFSFLKKARLFSREFFQVFKKNRKILKPQRYDLAFDLQGNCKSGLITFLIKAKRKIGFGRKSVAEWPNILATNHRYNVSSSLNIRLQYLQLLQSYFQDKSFPLNELAMLEIDLEDKNRVEKILLEPALQKGKKTLVSFGSRWENKRLSSKTLKGFLQKLHLNHSFCFLFVYQGEKEKILATALHREFKLNSLIIDSLSLSAMQHLIQNLDLVIAKDSAILHLAGMTKTPSFSIFGPSSSKVYKPLSNEHFVYQGSCPYMQKFTKRCSALRSCKTGSCMKDLGVNDLYSSFLQSNII